MWRVFRDLLQRWGLIDPLRDRLLVTGTVHHLKSDAFCTMTLTIGERAAEPRTLEAEGRFVLELPADELVRLAFAQSGYWPRMVEIRPSRLSLRSACDPVHARCELEVTLTSRFTHSGAPTEPLLERITMPQVQRPMVVEWDQVLRPSHIEQFVPMMARRDSAKA